MPTGLKSPVIAHAFLMALCQLWCNVRHVTLDTRPPLVFFLQVKKTERGLGTRLVCVSVWELVSVCVCVCVCVCVSLPIYLCLCVVTNFDEVYEDSHNAFSLSFALSPSLLSLSLPNRIPLIPIPSLPPPPVAPSQCREMWELCQQNQIIKVILSTCHWTCPLECYPVLWSDLRPLTRTNSQKKNTM